MKILKRLGLGLLALIGIVLILGLFAPREVTVERSLTIEAPATAIYAVVSNFETWPEWSVWFRMDSTMVVTPGETMAGEGATYTWTSENMGAGSQTILAADPGKSMKTELDFGMMGKAYGAWQFSPAAAGTEVSWALTSRTAYPLNSLILFMDMEESIGSDFERGLANLKEYVETNYSPPPAGSAAVSRLADYNHYFLLKKTATTLAGSEAFMQAELPALIAAARQAGIELLGPPAGLYYSWDRENDRTEMAVALPVAPGTTLDGYAGEAIAGPAVALEHRGGYAGLYDAHMALDAYLQANGLTMKEVAIEEYHRGPTEEADSTQWLTRVIYPVQS
jgi:uncharacterized membrane protein